MPRSTSRTLAALALAAGTAAAVPALAQSAAPGSAAPAVATAVSAEGAQAIAAAVDAGLRKWFPADALDGSMLWKGTTTATPSGDHYQVSLPFLSLVNDDKARLDVGVIRLAVKPLADGNHQVGIALPPSMPHFDAKGAPEGAMTIGRQQIFGVWAPRFQTFLSLDAAVGTVGIVNNKGQAKLRLADVAGKVDLKADGAGPNTYSGSSSFTLGGLQAHDEKGVSVANIGTMAIEATYGRLDLERLARLTDPAPPPAPVAAPAPAPRTNPPANGAPAPAPLPPMPAVPELQGLFGGAGFTLRLEDIAFTDTDDGSRFGWKQMRMQGGVDDLDKPMSRATLGFSQNGLAIEPLPGPGEFMPQSIEFALSMGKVPTAALSQAFASSSVPGLDIATAGAAAGFQFLGALGQAGSEITLDRLSVVTPATAGTLNGQATFTQSAAFGAVGAFSLVMRGLDTAIKALQPKRGAKPDPDTQGSIQALTMIQALGQQSKDERGQELRTYRIDLTPEGKLLLNGTDLAPLLGGGEAAPEPAPEPEPAKRGQKRT
ncbi:MAG TPA: hypothetical protein VD995_11905 [Azospirillum sp.]|nr:hypothetical protein [Azospirillum sp.]